MFERFTHQARRVVVVADEEARLLQHAFIGTEDLLLGLLHDGDAISARVLTSFDLDTDRVRGEVKERVAPSDKVPSSPPFTPRAKKILERSVRESLSLGHDYVGTEHLLLALLVEGDGVGAQILESMCGELHAIRRRVFEMLNLPVPPLATEPKPDGPRYPWFIRVPSTPWPAGTGRTPPLPVSDLEPRAWAALCWRQEHLPLDRLRCSSDWSALRSLESGAAWRLVDRLGLDDDQRCSLVAQHEIAVERRAALAVPALVETRDQLIARLKHDRLARRDPFDRWWFRNMPRWTVGWPTWFGNRRAGLRNKWFRLTTRRYYAGAPDPTR